MLEGRATVQRAQIQEWPDKDLRKFSKDKTEVLYWNSTAHWNSTGWRCGSRVAALQNRTCRTCCTRGTSETSWQ